MINKRVLYFLFFCFIYLISRPAESADASGSDDVAIRITTYRAKFDINDGNISADPIAIGEYLVAQKDDGRLIYFVNSQDVNQWLRTADGLAALFLQHHYRGIAPDMETACACHVGSPSTSAKELIRQQQTIPFQLSQDFSAQLLSCMHQFHDRVQPRPLVFSSPLPIKTDHPVSLLYGHDVCSAGPAPSLRSSSVGLPQNDGLRGPSPPSITGPLPSSQATSATAARISIPQPDPARSASVNTSPRPEPQNPTASPARGIRLPASAPSGPHDAAVPQVSVGGSPPTPAQPLLQAAASEPRHDTPGVSATEPRHAARGKLLVTPSVTINRLRPHYNLARAEALDHQGLPNDAHSHKRHGAQTTLPQQQVRVQTGLTPDSKTFIDKKGKVITPSRSTSYSSVEAELEAYDRAQLAIKRLNPPTTTIDHSGKVIGRREVVVVGGRKGGYGYGHEVLRDSAGVPLAGRPTRIVGPDPHARVVMEYHPGTQKWAAQSSFPTIDPVTPGTELTVLQRLRFAARPQVTRVLGVIGALGGLMQTNAGVEQLSNRQYVEGSANVSGGVLNVVSSIATASKYLRLGAVTAGAAAGIDGVKDIYVGIRDNNTEKKIIGTIKTGAGAAMLSGNPYAMAAGGVVYVGAVVYENRTAIKNGAIWVGRKVASWF